MIYPVPIYMGQFGPIVATNVVDRYLDITADLATGESISSVAFTVKDEAEATVAGVVGAHTETATRTDFRLTAPAAGLYTIYAVFTINDAQVITKTAGLYIV